MSTSQNLNGVVIFDGSNKTTVELPNGDVLGFKAIGDKIIVMYDTIRSGFECKTCNGSGKVEQGQTFVSGEWQPRKVDCPDCKGKGGLLILPEIAQTLPSTGVIVSVGPDCVKEHSVLGRHVVFSPHVGTMIPIKNNARFKIMREHEPLCEVYAEPGKEINSSDFIDYEQSIY